MCRLKCLEVCVCEVSVVEDAKVSRDDLVLQHGSSWDIDPVSMISDDDYRALKSIILTSLNIVKLVFVCGLRMNEFTPSA